MLCFFSFLRCGCRTANGRRKGRAADAGGFCLFGQHVCWGSDSDSESRHEHGNVSVERDVHGICWRRVSESGQKEEGNCDGRDVESRLFFCDLAYKSSEVCVIEFFIELSFSLAVTR